MAQVGEVRVGQVWADVRGRQFEVLTLLGGDGQFTVRNLETGRSAQKGPRALVQLVSHAPQQAPSAPTIAPPPASRRAPQRPRELTPAQIAAGFGGPQASPQEPHYGTVSPAPQGVSFEEFYGLGSVEAQQAPPLRAPTPPPRVVPRPAPRENGRHGPPMPSGWPSTFPSGLSPVDPRYFQAPPPEPYHTPVGIFPSPLVAFLCEQLVSMPPDRAASPGLVSQQVAHALAAWKSRPHS